MGMGFESISVYGANPTFQTFIKGGVLDYPMFGFKFDTSGSELFLGGVNPDYEEDDFTWVTLTNQVCHIFECVLIVSNECSALVGLLAGNFR